MERKIKKHNVLPSLIFIFVMMLPMMSVAQEVSLTLEQAVHQAIANNPDIQIEADYRDIAAEKIREEHGIFDPVISTSVNAIKDKVPIAEIFYPNGYYTAEGWGSGMEIGGKFLTGADYGLNFSYDRTKSDSETQTLSPRYYAKLNFYLVHPLLQGFGPKITKIRINLAEKDSQIARLTMTKKVLDTVVDVEKAWWDLVFADEYLDVSKKGLELSQKFRDEVNTKLMAGEMASIDLVAAEAEVALKESDVTEARNMVQKAGNYLKYLLDLGSKADTGSMIRPEKNPPSSFTCPDYADIADAVCRNDPELLKLNAELEKNALKLKYVRNQLWPKVDLFGEYGYKGMSGDPVNVKDIKDTPFEGKEDALEAFDGFFTGRGYDYYKVGVKFEAPIGNRKMKSQYAQQRIEKSQIRTQIHKRKREVETMVKVALDDISGSIARYRSTTAAADYSEKSLEAEKIKLIAGETTPNTIFSLQHQLTDMKVKALKAMLDYRTAWSRLKGMQGTSLKEYGLQIE
jgi:outer membrane protein TolC